MADMKLQALDSEDLGVVSAQCQDAVLRVGDLAYQPRERRFALVCNRFDWLAAQARGGRGPYQRRRTGLRFESVTRVQISGFDPRASETVLVLLAVGFEATIAPAGQITLHFAAGAAIRLDVETIEVELKDLGGVWSTNHRPDHAVADQAVSAVDAAPAVKPAKS